jgi:hypothetical protein
MISLFFFFSDFFAIPALHELEFTPEPRKIGIMIWYNDDPPPQGLSEARRGKEVSFILIFSN